MDRRPAPSRTRHPILLTAIASVTLMTAALVFAPEITSTGTVATAFPVAQAGFARHAAIGG